MCDGSMYCPGISFAPDRIFFAHRANNDNCYFLIPDDEINALASGVFLQLNKAGSLWTSDQPESFKGNTVKSQPFESVWRNMPNGVVVQDFTFANGSRHRGISKACMVTMPVPTSKSDLSKNIVRPGPFVVVQSRCRGANGLLLVPVEEANQLSESICWDVVARHCRRGYIAQELFETKPGLEVRMLMKH